VVLNPVLNLHVYRRGLSSLWRRLERLEAIELESSEKSMVYECAKILAEVSGLPRNKTYQRITPRTEEELRAVKDLYEAIKARSIDELRDPVEFCTIFLNWKPLTINTESEDIKIDIAYSKDAVDGKEVLASYAKLIDTNTKLYLLIAWPKLSSEAKNLATHYKINTIEASTIEELEARLANTLNQLKGGCNPSSDSEHKTLATA
jgi:hypothetical protein